MTSAEAFDLLMSAAHMLVLLFGIHCIFWHRNKKES